LTDHPKLKPGIQKYEYHFGDYSYLFSVNGPGDYNFYMRTRIK